MMRTGNLASEHKILSKENALLLTILATSALLAVIVFAGHSTWVLIPFDNGGTASTPTLSQSYINSQYTNTSINITQNITVVNNTINISWINITSTNASGWNFLGSGTYNSSAVTAVFNGGAGGNTGWTSLNLTNGSNPMIPSGTNQTIWFVVGINASTEGIYQYVMNITSNHSGTGQLVGNTSSFTILADWTNPRYNSTATNDSDHIATPDQTVKINFTVFDDNLNFTQIGAHESRLNITLYNASGNSTSSAIYHIPSANITNVTHGLADNTWNFSVALRPNASMGSVVEVNWTAQITMVDNASNSVTAYATDAWVWFDNKSPAVTSTNPTNNTQNVDIATGISIYFHEMLNGNSVNNTTVTLYKTSDGTNVSVAATYQNSSNTGVVTITPNGSLVAGANYTVNISSYNSSNRITDLAGNNIGNNFLTFTFTTTPAAAAPGGGPGGAGAPSAATAGTVGGISPSTAELTASISTGGTLNIEIQVPTPEGGTTSEDHKMEVLSIVGSLVKLKFTSAPVFVDVNVGETKYVDINGDGVNDVRVTVNSVSAGVANVTVELLPAAKGEAKKAYIPSVPETPAVQQPTTTEPGITTVPTAVEKPAAPSRTLMLVVVVALVVIAAAYWFTQKGGISPKRYE